MPPSKAEIYDQWAKAINVLENNRLYGNKNATNFISLIDTVQQAYEGEFLDEAENAIQQIRGNLAGSVDFAIAAAVQRPFLKQFCRSVVGRSNLVSDSQMFDEMRKYFIDNAERVQSRDMTFGAPTAKAGRVGNDQVIRLTKDEDNFDIETGFIDVKRAICVADRQTGAQIGRETWLFRGQAPARDELQRSGSGLETIIAARSADDSLLNNPNFQQFGNTVAAPDEITDWTATDLAGAAVTMSGTFCELDSANTFRKAPSDGDTTYSLKVKSDLRLSQKLSVRGTQLDRSRPHLLAVVWNAAVGSANGTLLIRMGKVWRQVTVTGASGWNVTLVEATPGPGAWYKTFGEDDMEISFDVDLSSGSLLIAEVLFVQMDFFDGSWYSIIPASVTTHVPSFYLDEFTMTDQATESVVQRWLARAFGRYLPHSLGSSITFPNP